MVCSCVAEAGVQWSTFFLRGWSIVLQAAALENERMSSIPEGNDRRCCTCLDPMQSTSVRACRPRKRRREGDGRSWRMEPYWPRFIAVVEVDNRRPGLEITYFGWRIRFSCPTVLCWKIAKAVEKIRMQGVQGYRPGHHAQENNDKIGIDANPLWRLCRGRCRRRLILI